ncbi:trypsin-like serine protease [Sorangium cellulosum]|uniref:trypsin-like serine protease n=1 Tax=Sorangium cellulosum TaxID=56 RepID=UPI0010127E5B|nr:trypsin-like serine protease [Sorangium cellulosum]
MQRRVAVCRNNTAWSPLAGCLIAAATLAGCAGYAEEPGPRREDTDAAALEIKGGYPDEEDRAVAGLLITDRRGRVARTCSSALIAPNLVLTAQHCIADAPKLIACKTATFGEPVDASQVFATLGSALWAADAPWLSARAVLSPPDGNAVCGRDLALVVLSSPLRASDVTPLAPRLGRPPEVSEVYSAVGFGDTEGRARDGGARRRRDGLRIECVGYGCGRQERITGSEWRGESGICSGDSGGPALDLAGRIIGVTSRGPAGCADPIYGGLIAHRDWLVTEARRAAEADDYDVPWWATASDWAERLPAHRPVDERWLSCAHGPAVASPPGDGGAASALALLALLARKRSRDSASPRRVKGAARSTISA